MVGGPNYMMMPGGGRGGVKNGRGGGMMMPKQPRQQPGGPMKGGAPPPMGGVPQPMAGGVPMPVGVPAGGPAAVDPAVIMQAGGVVPSNLIPLHADLLNQLPPEEQKRLVGERLYLLIAKVEDKLCGKITGMLLESCTNEELLYLIDNNAALHEKIEEAIKVLREHEKSQV